MGLLKKIFGDYSAKEVKRVMPLVDKVLSYEEEYSKLSDSELKAKTPEFKERLQNGETLDDILPEAFAACREASWRVLQMKHFPVQIIGGIILHQGRIAEMKTGEGKTLVATLPAYLNALAGKGVHIVTVNDYLARRDSEWMGKVYRFMGLSVGLVVAGLENSEKHAAYDADITYGTNNEMGFDYLRDNMVQYIEQKVQRGHSFAIVDEVDSILIDEARTPLIISGMGGESSELYKLADNFVKGLKMAKVTELNAKEAIEKNEDIKKANADYVVDEKAKTAVLTEQGVKKAEEYFDVEMLSAPENLTLAHHIDIAIKARGVMKRDIDYVVKDNQVLIVDEFTGRIMIGRRYSDGLHQAIEAKENVNVAKESKTLATITFQNYFRLYNKLSGMTGTALTEADEFQQIYSLDAIEIPTNRPLIRQDNDDVIYMNEAFKFDAIIEQILKCHEKGQPVLVGTVSIEKSEKLSRALKKRGIQHNVLNAKFHDKEAEIVAQAGKLGAVTIATNMAGRGTDIMLGGNAEFLAKSEMRKLGYAEELIAEATGFGETDNEDILEAREKFSELEKKYKEEIKDEAQAVREAGGLFIIGTERHESRRIDNQLRGRSGRQGDPGESRFYLSMEDDLLRLFGGERIKTIMSTLTRDNPQPLQMGMLTKSVESAQKKMEGNNFATRLHVLSYDDVMNKQREIIYGQRDRVLGGEDMKSVITKMLDDSLYDNIEFFCPDSVDRDEWNYAGLKNKYAWLLGDTDIDNMKKEEIYGELVEKAHEVYEQKEAEFGAETMREIERMALLRSVDVHWMDHIDAMDEFKRSVGLRAYGQQDPVLVFRNESGDMFEEMTNEIREDTVRMVLTIRMQKNEQVERKAVAKVTTTGGDGTEKKQPVRKSKKVGPNDPCPCGSGKKYKKCCGNPANRG